MGPRTRWDTIRRALVSVVLALAAVAERPADSRSDPRTAPCHSTRRSRETSRPPPSARWTCCTSAARFDPVCAAAFPHPACDLEALLARLERAPVTAALKHPRTGADVEVTLTRNTVAEIVRVALYTPQDAARLLPVIRRALDGDSGRWAPPCSTRSGTAGDGAGAPSRGRAAAHACFRSSATSHSRS